MLDLVFSVAKRWINCLSFIPSWDITAWF